MKITIRLTGEDKEKKFKGIEIDSQIHIDELMKLIEGLTAIQHQYQELEFRGNELSDDDRPLVDIKDNEEVVVKHIHLTHWKAYENRVEEFTHSQTSESKRCSAKQAQRFYDLLLKSAFFLAYATFDVKVTQLHKPISRYLNKKIRWIKNAAVNFFTLSLFKGQNPEFDFQETEKGSHSAVVCKVSMSSITYKYRIKTNHNAEDSSRASRWDLDLIELFCYKFLESIAVGPRILFIPNCVASKSILYIGSEWLEDFQPFHSIEQGDTQKLTRTVVEIHFLSVYLSLGDMHEGNFGTNAHTDPIIVDFLASNHSDPKDKFLRNDNTIRSLRARDILSNVDTPTRLNYAKEAILKWNLLEKLDETLVIM